MRIRPDDFVAIIDSSAMPSAKTRAAAPVPLTPADWDLALRRQDEAFRSRLRNETAALAASNPAWASKKELAFLAAGAKILPEALLRHPSLHGWLFAAARAGRDPGPAELEVLSQAGAFAAGLACLLGRQRELSVRLDRRGHLHLYGTRSYLDFGPRRAGETLALSVRSNGLSVRGAGRPPLKKLPVVGLGTEVSECDPVLIFPLAESRGDYDHALAKMTPKELARFVSTLREGFSRAEQADPEMGRSLFNAIGALVPLARKDPRRHVSSTFSHLRGAVFLCHDDNPLLQAETLVHEASHNQLHTLQELGPLFESGDKDLLYYSPWRTDPRALPGILLGAHAFLAVARLMYAASAKTLDAARRREYLENAAYRCLQVETALDAVRRHARLTELGARLMAGLERELSAVLKTLPPRPGGVWGAAKEAAEPHRLRHLKPGTCFHREAA